MKRTVCLVLAIVMCLSLCACGGGSKEKDIRKASKEEFAVGYAKAVCGKDESKLKDYMHGTLYNEYSRELRENGEDLVFGIEVISAKVVDVDKRDKDEYQERMADYFDVYADVEEAYYIRVGLEYMDEDGNYRSGPEENLVVEIAKIDGKWYGFKIH